MSIIISLLICFSCNENREKENGTNSRAFIPDHDANPELSVAEIIAYKHRVDLWDDVSTLKFTFNVDRGERHFERSFIWSPKTDDVVYLGVDDTVSFNRKNLKDSTEIKADQRFINDSYWLLSPYKLVWDKGTNITSEEDVIAPISKDTLNKLTVVYGSEGGYTPGDAYDFYYTADHMIKEWVFRKGNSEAPSTLTTFEELKTANGLKLYTMHRDSISSYSLYFTDISVE